MILLIGCLINLCFCYYFKLKKNRSAQFINLIYIGFYSVTYLDIFKLYPISNKVQLIFTIGLLSFNLGCIFNFKTLKIKTKYNYRVKYYKLQVFLSTIIFLFLVYFSSKTLKLILNGTTLGYIRINFFSSDGGIVLRNRIVQIIYIFFLIPLVNAQYILGLNEYFERKKKILLLFGLANNILLCIVSVGRMPLVFVIIYTCFFILNSCKKLNILKNKIIIIPISIILYMSYLRGKDRGGFLESIKRYLILYFTGSFSALTKFLEKEELSIFYGRGTFGFVDLLITPFLKRLGVVEESSLLTIIHTMNNQFINIGNENWVNYNAFYTMYQIFYLDFKYFGVILIPFFLGLILGKINRKYIITEESIYLIYLSFFCFIYIKGLLEWTFLSIQPVIILTFIKISMKKIKVN